MTHASIPADARAELGLSDSLIRLSPGCENAQDLVDDLLEGLTLLDHQRRSQKAVAASAQ
jgi:cystathionine gamma-lyase / homocysteine desulfhydrase